MRIGNFIKRKCAARICLFCITYSDPLLAIKSMIKWYIGINCLILGFHRSKNDSGCHNCIRDGYQSCSSLSRSIDANMEGALGTIQWLFSLGLCCFYHCLGISSTSIEPYRIKLLLSRGGDLIDPSYLDTTVHTPLSNLYHLITSQIWGRQLVVCPRRTT